MAPRDKLQRGTRKRQRIDAAMRIEVTVLIGQQQPEIAGIDGGPGIDRQALPAAIRHRVGTQQLAVAVDDGGGDLPGLSSGRGPSEGVTQAAKTPVAIVGGNRDGRRLPDPSPARSFVARRRYDRRSAHFADRTSTAPVPERPARGAVHVLDRSLRQHVFARRHRAHDIGNREHGFVIAFAIDGCVKRSSRNSVFSGSSPSSIQSSVPLSPDDTCDALSIRGPAGR